MLAPYYERGGITIYQGDCREILPNLPKVDAVITDPPYGQKLKPTWSWNAGKYVPVKGDDEPFDPSFLIGTAPLCLFGANYFADKLPASSTWIAWDKRCGPSGECDDMADCEFAWLTPKGPSRVFRHHWTGFLRASENETVRQHPTQKPVALIAWVIKRFFPDAEMILDPFMGSGTTLIAAKHLGLKGIGIEIEQHYCEVAAERLTQEILDFSKDVVEVEEQYRDVFINKRPIQQVFSFSEKFNCA